MAKVHLARVARLKQGCITLVVAQKMAVEQGMAHNPNLHWMPLPLNPSSAGNSQRTNVVFHPGFSVSVWSPAKRCSQHSGGCHIDESKHVA
eukprot:4461107-Amphidinium_carterae.1